MDKILKVHTDGGLHKILIGLTGPYCAGKNYVGRILEDWGFPVLDVDKLGHQALELEKDAVTARFGAIVLNSDGTIDRKALGRLVFGDPKALNDLEAIVHPRANALTLEWIAQQDKQVLVINAALLHKSILFSELTAIILVQAPYLTRLLRARKRDKLPYLSLIQRLNSQKQFFTQYFRSTADIYTVSNRGLWTFCSSWHRTGLERRLEHILREKGLVR
ncbi:MAG: dephospho-CoA kinase [Termitinemataceae bacterium]